MSRNVCHEFFSEYINACIVLCYIYPIIVRSSPVCRTRSYRSVVDRYMVFNIFSQKYVQKTHCSSKTLYNVLELQAVIYGNTNDKTNSALIT